VIALVDYGAGNRDNALRALRRLGREALPVADPAGLPERPELILLPGVGAFPPAMAALRRSGWDRAIRELAGAGTGILGICLGMQLLAEASTEDGLTPGLGLIRGTLIPLRIPLLPHMGWNRFRFVADWPGLAGAGEERDAYFVHSYALPEGGDAAALCEESGVSFAAAVRSGNVAGVQFHPERSGAGGLALLDRILRSLGSPGRTAPPAASFP